MRPTTLDPNCNEAWENSSGGHPGEQCPSLVLASGPCTECICTNKLTCNLKQSSRRPQTSRVPTLLSHATSYILCSSDVSLSLACLPLHMPPLAPCPCFQLLLIKCCTFKNQVQILTLT